MRIIKYLDGEKKVKVEFDRPITINKVTFRVVVLPEDDVEGIVT